MVLVAARLVKEKTLKPLYVKRGLNSLYTYIAAEKAIH
jgi:hypothetical protein